MGRTGPTGTGTEADGIPLSASVSGFNAVYERRWVAGWNPRFVHPAEPRAAEDIVIQTGKEGLGTATWVQTAHECERFTY